MRFKGFNKPNIHKKSGRVFKALLYTSAAVLLFAVFCSLFTVSGIYFESEKTKDQNIAEAAGAAASTLQTFPIDLTAGQVTYTFVPDGSKLGHNWGPDNSNAGKGSSGSMESNIGNHTNRDWETLWVDIDLGEIPSLLLSNGMATLTASASAYKTNNTDEAYASVQTSSSQFTNWSSSQYEDAYNAAKTNGYSLTNSSTAYSWTLSAGRYVRFYLGGVDNETGLFGGNWGAIYMSGMQLTFTITAFSGTGTSGNPFLISNATQLNNLAVCVNTCKWNMQGRYFRQTANISATSSMAPIGASSTLPFRGTYNGNGYTVTLSMSRTSSTTALFGYINGATITNLTTSGSVAVTSSGDYIGGIVAYAAGGSVISNCTNNASVTYTGTASNYGYYTGGIVGYLDGSSQVTRCTNNGTITSSHSTGGIVGYLSNGTVSYCVNFGTIAKSATFNSAGAGGGIVGMISSTSGNSVSYCYSSANVTAAKYAGGIIGQIPSSSLPAGSVKFCYTNNLTSYYTVDTSISGASKGAVVGYTASPTILEGCWAIYSGNISALPSGLNTGADGYGNYIIFNTYYSGSSAASYTINMNSSTSSTPNSYGSMLGGTSVENLQFTVNINSSFTSGYYLSMVYAGGNTGVTLGTTSRSGNSVARNMPAANSNYAFTSGNRGIIVSMRPIESYDIVDYYDNNPYDISISNLPSGYYTTLTYSTGSAPKNAGNYTAQVLVYNNSAKTSAYLMGEKTVSINIVPIPLNINLSGLLNNTYNGYKQSLSGVSLTLDESSFTMSGKTNVRGNGEAVWKALLSEIISHDIAGSGNKYNGGLKLLPEISSTTYRLSTSNNQGSGASWDGNFKWAGYYQFTNVVLVKDNLTDTNGNYTITSGSKSATAQILPRTISGTVTDILSVSITISKVYDNFLFSLPTVSGAKTYTYGGDVYSNLFNFTDVIWSNVVSATALKIKINTSGFNGSVYAQNYSGNSYALSSNNFRVNAGYVIFENGKSSVSVSIDTSSSDFGYLSEKTVMYAADVMPTSNFAELGGFLAGMGSTLTFNSFTPQQWGSEDHPFVIANATHLNNLSKLVRGDSSSLSKNSIVSQSGSFRAKGYLGSSGSGIYSTYASCYFVVTSSVAVNPFTPIGNSSRYFSGTFDGRNNTITVTINSTGGYIGLFGHLNITTIESGNGAETYYYPKVKNLSVSGTVKGSGQYIGAIAGYVNGGASNAALEELLEGGASASDIEAQATLYKVTNFAVVTAASASDSYVGGIIGYGNNVNIIYPINSTNSINRDGTTPVYARYVGGIAGYLAGAILGEYDGANTTYNTSRSTYFYSGDYSGGLVGASDSLLLHSVVAGGYIDEGASYTGGLLGYSSTNVRIVNSVNAMNYVRGKVLGTGGFIGYMAGGIVNIKTSRNSAQIMSYGGSGGHRGIGGFIGYMAGGSVTISADSEAGEQVLNSGPVSGEASSVGIGGFIGYIYKGTVILQGNLRNTGNITGSAGASAIGGFIGYVEGAPNIQGSELVNSTTVSIGPVSMNYGLISKGIPTNAGQIGSTSVTLSKIGGILGSAQNGTITILGALNNANIFQAQTAGGRLGGIAGSLAGDYVYGGTTYSLLSVTVTSCANSGGLSGYDYAGGLIGYAYNLILELKSSSNASTISARTYTGGVIGYVSSLKSQSALSMLYNGGSVTGTSYVGGIAGGAYYKISDAVNAGNVSASSYGGGIAGQVLAQEGILTNVYFLGALTLSGYSNGAIIGGVSGTAASNQIIDAYFISSSLPSTGTNRPDGSTIRGYFVQYTGGVALKPFNHNGGTYIETINSNGSERNLNWSDITAVAINGFYAEAQDVNRFNGSSAHMYMYAGVLDSSGNLGYIAPFNQLYDLSAQAQNGFSAKGLRLYFMTSNSPVSYRYNIYLGSEQIYLLGDEDNNGSVYQTYDFEPWEIESYVPSGAKPYLVGYEVKIKYFGDAQRQNEISLEANPLIDVGTLYATVYVMFTGAGGGEINVGRWNVTITVNPRSLIDTTIADVTGLVYDIDEYGNGILLKPTPQVTFNARSGDEKTVYNDFVLDNVVFYYLEKSFENYFKNMGYSSPNDPLFRNYLLTEGNSHAPSYDWFVNNPLYVAENGVADSGWYYLAIVSISPNYHDVQFKRFEIKAASLRIEYTDFDWSELLLGKVFDNSDSPASSARFLPDALFTASTGTVLSLSDITAAGLSIIVNMRYFTKNTNSAQEAKGIRNYNGKFYNYYVITPADIIITWTNPSRTDDIPYGVDANQPEIRFYGYGYTERLDANGEFVYDPNGEIIMDKVPVVGEGNYTTTGYNFKKGLNNLSEKVEIYRRLLIYNWYDLLGNKYNFTFGGRTTPQKQYDGTLDFSGASGNIVYNGGTPLNLPAGISESAWMPAVAYAQFNDVSPALANTLYFYFTLSEKENFCLAYKVFQGSDYFYCYDLDVLKNPSYNCYDAATQSFNSNLEYCLDLPATNAFIDADDNLSSKYGDLLVRREVNGEYRYVFKVSGSITKRIVTYSAKNFIFTGSGKEYDGTDRFYGSVSQNLEVSVSGAIAGEIPTVNIIGKFYSTTADRNAAMSAYETGTYYIKFAIQLTSAYSNFYTLGESSYVFVPSTTTYTISPRSIDIAVYGYANPSTAYFTYDQPTNSWVISGSGTASVTSGTSMTYTSVAPVIAWRVQTALITDYNNYTLPSGSGGKMLGIAQGVKRTFEGAPMSAATYDSFDNTRYVSSASTSTTRVYYGGFYLGVDASGQHNYWIGTWSLEQYDISNKNYTYDIAGLTFTINRKTTGSDYNPSGTNSSYVTSAAMTYTASAVNENDMAYPIGNVGSDAHNVSTENGDKKYMNVINLNTNKAFGFTSITYITFNNDYGYGFDSSASDGMNCIWWVDVYIMPDSALASAVATGRTQIYLNSYFSEAWGSTHDISQFGIAFIDGPNAHLKPYDTTVEPAWAQGLKDVSQGNNNTGWCTIPAGTTGIRLIFRHTPGGAYASVFTNIWFKFRLVNYTNYSNANYTVVHSSIDPGTASNSTHGTKNMGVSKSSAILYQGGNDQYTSHVVLTNLSYWWYASDAELGTITVDSSKPGWSVSNAGVGIMGVNFNLAANSQLAIAANEGRLRISVESVVESDGAIALGVAQELMTNAQSRVPTNTYQGANWKYGVSEKGDNNRLGVYNIFLEPGNGTSSSSYNFCVYYTLSGKKLRVKTLYIRYEIMEYMQVGTVNDTKISDTVSLPTDIEHTNLHWWRTNETHINLIESHSSKGNDYSGLDSIYNDNHGNLGELGFGDRAWYIIVGSMMTGNWLGNPNGTNFITETGFVINNPFMREAARNGMLQVKISLYIGHYATTISNPETYYVGTSVGLPNSSYRKTAPPVPSDIKLEYIPNASGMFNSGKDLEVTIPNLQCDENGHFTLWFFVKGVNTGDIYFWLSKVNLEFIIRAEGTGPELKNYDSDLISQVTYGSTPDVVIGGATLTNLNYGFTPPSNEEQDWYVGQSAKFVFNFAPSVTKDTISQAQLWVGDESTTINASNAIFNGTLLSGTTQIVGTGSLSGIIANLTLKQDPSKGSNNHSNYLEIEVYIYKSIRGIRARCSDQTLQWSETKTIRFNTDAKGNIDTDAPSVFYDIPSEKSWVTPGAGKTLTIYFSDIGSSVDTAVNGDALSSKWGFIGVARTVYEQGAGGMAFYSWQYDTMDYTSVGAWVGEWYCIGKNNQNNWAWIKIVANGVENIVAELNNHYLSETITLDGMVFEKGYHAKYVRHNTENTTFHAAAIDRAGNYSRFRSYSELKHGVIGSNPEDETKFAKLMSNGTVSGNLSNSVATGYYGMNLNSLNFYNMQTELSKFAKLIRYAAPVTGAHTLELYLSATTTAYVHMFTVEGRRIYIEASSGMLYYYPIDSTEKVYIASYSIASASVEANGRYFYKSGATTLSNALKIDINMSAGERIYFAFTSGTTSNLTATYRISVPSLLYKYTPVPAYDEEGNPYTIGDYSTAIDSNTLASKDGLKIYAGIGDRIEITRIYEEKIRISFGNLASGAGAFNSDSDIIVSYRYSFDGGSTYGGWRILLNNENHSGYILDDANQVITLDFTNKQVNSLILQFKLTTGNQSKLFDAYYFSGWSFSVLDLIDTRTGEIERDLTSIYAYSYNQGIYKNFENLGKAGLDNEDTPTGKYATYYAPAAAKGVVGPDYTPHLDETIAPVLRASSAIISIYCDFGYIFTYINGQDVRNTSTKVYNGQASTLTLNLKGAGNYAAGSSGNFATGNPSTAFANGTSTPTAMASSTSFGPNVVYSTYAPGSYVVAYYASQVTVVNNGETIGRKTVYHAILPRRVNVTLGNGSSIYGEQVNTSGVSRTASGVTGTKRYDLTGGSVTVTLNNNNTNVLTTVDELDLTIKIVNSVGAEIGPKQGVGTYTVSATAGNLNYDVTYVNGTWQITKRSAVIRILDRQVAYGNAMNFTSVAGVDWEDITSSPTGGILSGDNLNIVLSSTRAISSPVGNYPISAIYNNDNYNVTFTGSYGGSQGTLTVVPREVEIKIGDKTSVYGNSITASGTAAQVGVTLTVLSANGLAPFDSIDSLGIILYARLTRGGSLITLRTPVGDYPIEGTWTNTNYNIVFKNGSFDAAGDAGKWTVTKRTVQVGSWSLRVGSVTGTVVDSSAPYSVTYSGQYYYMTGTISNKLDGDEVNFIYSGQTGRNAGSYTTTVTGISGAAIGNYVFGIGNSQVSWTITECILTLEFAASRAMKYYDGTTLYDSFSNGGGIYSTKYSADYYGFTVTGLPNITDDIAVSVYIREADRNRAEFDTFVNGVHRSGGDYAINPAFKKELYVVITGAAVNNYLLKYNSQQTKSSMTISSDAGFDIEIRQRQIYASYNDTRQSYRDAKGNLLDTYRDVTGYIQTGFDSVLLIITQGFKTGEKLDGSKTYSQYTVISGNNITTYTNGVQKTVTVSGPFSYTENGQSYSYDTLLSAKLSSSNGTHMNYQLMNQPTLIIGYFVSSDGVMEVDSLAALLMVEKYYTVEPTTEYVWNDELNDGEGGYELIEIKNYERFKQTFDISGILTERDLSILKAEFGDAYSAKMSVGSIVIVSGAVVKGMFNGIYDGGGKVISDIIIVGSTFGGLFEAIGTAGVVKNTHLRNVTVTVASDGNAYAGAVAAVNFGIIKNCTSLIDISVSAQGYATVGAITGINNGQISYASAAGRIIASAAMIYAGGIAGVSNQGTLLSNMISAVELRAHGNIGALIGFIGAVAYDVASEEEIEEAKEKGISIDLYVILAIQNPSVSVTDAMITGTAQYLNGSVFNDQSNTLVNKKIGNGPASSGISYVGIRENGEAEYAQSLNLQGQSYLIYAAESNETGERNMALLYLTLVDMWDGYYLNVSHLGSGSGYYRYASDIDEGTAKYLYDGSTLKEYSEGGSGEIYFEVSGKDLYVYDGGLYIDFYQFIQSMGGGKLIVGSGENARYFVSETVYKNLKIMKRHYAKTNNIKINFANQLSLMRAYRFMTFTLQSDMNLYAGGKTTVAEGAFYGGVLTSGGEKVINIRGGAGDAALFEYMNAPSLTIKAENEA